VNELHNGETRKKHPFTGGAYLLFERDGTEVAIEKRYGEKDMGLEVRGTTSLSTLSEAILDGAVELLDRMDEYDDPEIPALEWLQESVERLEEQMKN
jgi:hypothetical protein